MDASRPAKLLLYLPLAWIAIGLASRAGYGAPPEDVPDSPGRITAGVARREIDAGRAARAGIRKLTGKHITLFTDLGSCEEVDALPEVFDQAFPQWCRYFGVSPQEHADWRVNGFVMKEKSRFQQTGLLPDDLPVFPNGYSRNYELWLYEQPSDYYRRHLLLHEGTHSFMRTILGACGPPWYMEGMAELLGTHRWHDRQLTLNYLPASRDEVPMWGRIKLIQDAVAERRAKRLPTVIEYSTRAHRQTEPYAVLAATVLLDRHPRYRDRFHELHRYVQDPHFNERFMRLFAPDWQQLCEEWQLMVVDLQYGHEIARTAIDFLPGAPLPPRGAQVQIAADRGWQSSRVQLEAGKTYRLTASGRYQVAKEPPIWWCEPGGVSIHYHEGRPLGIVLAAVRPEQPNPDASSLLLRPIVVGLGTTLHPPQTGTLYLKINQSPAQLSHSAGEVSVAIQGDR